MAENAEKACIYCGNPAKKVREGEHIVQQAIGGELTIKEISGRLVCNPCNNGQLSVIDNELCRRSYLAHIASEELDACLWQVWGVDEVMGNQLIEARPVWAKGELQRLFYFPQIIFEPRGMSIRGDGDDILRYGNEAFRNILFRAVSDAYKRFNYKHKNNGLFFEQIGRRLLNQGYRYDPRVFIRRTIAEVADGLVKQEFTLRYASTKDKLAALRQLDSFNVFRRSIKWTQKPSAPQVRMASSFDIVRTMRGLIKIGFNILAAYCEKTPVDRKTFNVVPLILGEIDPSVKVVENNGFVRAADLTELNAPDRSHAFRLTWVGNEWLVYLSFFGGRIGAAVRFPGQNLESWNTLDIVAPLHSKNWVVKRSKIMRLIPVQIRWKGLQDIAPTVRAQNLTAEFRA